MADAFAGIDVACAKDKRLPVVVCVRNGDALVPLQLRGHSVSPPRGMGNALTIDAASVERFADETTDYLRCIENAFSVRIARIAIDAPSEPKRKGTRRRDSECELDRRRISCFTTPDEVQFRSIIERVREHLEAGGAHNRIPHANQLWMLVGFALFRALRPHLKCIEVFPQAIAYALGVSGLHKSSPEGRARQLASVARYTSWPFPCAEAALKPIGFGPAHDLLDAYSSAWVASLREDECEPLGCPPRDAIWVPGQSFLQLPGG